MPNPIINTNKIDLLAPVASPIPNTIFDVKFNRFTAAKIAERLPLVFWSLNNVNSIPTPFHSKEAPKPHEQQPITNNTSDSIQTAIAKGKYSAEPIATEIPTSYFFKMVGENITPIKNTMYNNETDNDPICGKTTAAKVCAGRKQKKTRKIASAKKNTDDKGGNVFFVDGLCDR